MGRLQSRVLNTCTAPPACWNIGTGAKLAAFAFQHENALRCCLETLYRAHEIGALPYADACHCRECPRVWRLASGWWAIGRREKAERFKRGQEISRERIAAAQKRGASKRSIMGQQASQRKATKR